MDYVNLGRSGLKVSRICLGAMSFGNTSPYSADWMLSEAESRPFIKRALELGINYFDTADMYSRGLSEEVLGRALKDFAPREDVVIATKVYFPMSENPNGRGLSRKHLMNSIDASLRRLGTDHVDIYQVHRWDHETPLEETLEALHDIVRAGKARYIGASSMYAWQFMKALMLADKHGWTRFASMQNHYNLLYREEEREMLPLCREEGIAVNPWSPLARGRLARNPSKGEEGTTRENSDYIGNRMYRGDSDRRIRSYVADVAARREVPMAQVALAWLLRQPGVTAATIGVTKMSHLETAVEALNFSLSDEECSLLERAYEPKGVLGHE